MHITIVVKQVYKYISQVSGERLKDHWSSCHLFHCRFPSVLLTECMENLKWGPGKLYSLLKDYYIYLLQPDITVILFNISVESTHVLKKIINKKIKINKKSALLFYYTPPAKRSFRGVYCFQPVRDSVIPSFRQHFDIFAE